MWSVTFPSLSSGRIGTGGGQRSGWRAGGRSWAGHLRSSSKGGKGSPGRPLNTLRLPLSCLCICRTNTCVSRIYVYSGAHLNHIRVGGLQLGMAHSWCGWGKFNCKKRRALYRGLMRMLFWDWCLFNSSLHLVCWIKWRGQWRRKTKTKKEPVQKVVNDLMKFCRMTYGKHSPGISWPPILSLVESDFTPASAQMSGGQGSVHH